MRKRPLLFSENLRRQSRWGEIDYYLFDLLKRELQEKYFVGTGSEDDYWKEREYSRKTGYPFGGSFRRFIALCLLCGGEL